MKFILEIQLGNDAMRDETDLALAIYDAAKRAANLAVDIPYLLSVKDINGNTVGTMELRKEGN